MKKILYRKIINEEIGFVVAAKKYLIQIEGIPGAEIDDLIVSEDGVRAVVVSFDGEQVSAMVLDHILAKPGDRFVLVGKENIFSLSDALLGRVINVLGEPLDKKVDFAEPETPLEFDVEAPGMEARRRIDEQFLTGVMTIDMLLPIAKGQRELIFGPAHSGKTLFLRDLVANQRESDMVCIYAAIGKPTTSIQPFISHIYGENGNKKAIILVASSDDSTPNIIIAPTVAMLIADYFQKKGKDVLLILDDLATHAKYARELALLQGRLPGRESYPGDMFYQHARIIERAGSFNEKGGGGSITLLPVLETEIENYTDLIPTNLMSATDGHLMFSAEMRAQGIYPSIVEEKSVTRVGRSAQSLIQKQLSTQVLSLLARFRREQDFIQFGAPVNEETKKILKQGEIIYAILKQDSSENIPIIAQVLLLALVFSSFSDKHDAQFFEKNRKAIIQATTEDASLKELSNVALSLEKFLETLEAKINAIEKICQS